MITPELKEAWAKCQLPCSINSYPGLVARAYLDAEWRRRRAEFEANHPYAERWPVRQWWTDDQWRQEVIAELER